jgi:DNA-nicking Smr family endonuclease
MAKSNDFADLASLFKTERKLARHERRAHARAQADRAESTPSTAPPATAAEPLRFADYFKPWSEFKAPDSADVALFRNAVKDAAPLTKNDRAELNRPKPKPHAHQHHADELAALGASQLAMYPSPMSWDIGADIEDEQSFLRSAVSPELLRKLRRGQWTIDAEIDLHHHTQDEAHEALQVFMQKARTQGFRCVRIIHGKGLSSHQKIPVLRSKVRRWLQQKDEVLAYCEPRPNGGGSGAVLVLLRGTK